MDNLKTLNFLFVQLNYNFNLPVHGYAAKHMAEGHFIDLGQKQIFLNALLLTEQ